MLYAGVDIGGTYIKLGIVNIEAQEPPASLHCTQALAAAIPAEPSAARSCTQRTDSVCVGTENAKAVPVLLAQSRIPFPTGGGWPAAADCLEAEIHGMLARVAEKEAAAQSRTAAGSAEMRGAAEGSRPAGACGAEEPADLAELKESILALQRGAGTNGRINTLKAPPLLRQWPGGEAPQPSFTAYAHDQNRKQGQGNVEGAGADSEAAGRAIRHGVYEDGQQRGIGHAGSETEAAAGCNVGRTLPMLRRWPQKKGEAKHEFPGEQWTGKAMDPAEGFPAGESLKAELQRRHTEKAEMEAELCRRQAEDLAQKKEGLHRQAESYGARAEIRYEAGALPKLAGIGIAVPGSIDASGSCVLEAHNLGFHNAPVRADMERRFPGTKIALLNDADAAALAELHCGVLRGVQTGVLLTIGTGLGGGLILNNRLFRGGGGRGTEPGHMIIDRRGAQCTCGSRGCAETICSASWLAEQGRLLQQEWLARQGCFPSVAAENAERLQEAGYFDSKENTEADPEPLNSTSAVSMIKQQSQARQAVSAEQGDVAQPVTDREPPCDRLWPDSPESAPFLMQTPHSDRAATGLEILAGAGQKIEAIHVIEAARAGDPDAARIFREFLDALSDAIASIANLLDPEVIALGGGVSLAGSELYEPLTSLVREKSFFHAAYKILPATLGNHAGLLGAALQACEE